MPKPKQKKSSSKEDKYVVEKILDKKGSGRKLQYRIKWKGYGEEENSWEPAANCDCPDLIAEYEAERKQKQEAAKGDGRRKRKSDDDVADSPTKKKKTNTTKSASPDTSSSDAESKNAKDENPQTDHASTSTQGSQDAAEEEKRSISQRLRSKNKKDASIDTASSAAESEESANVIKKVKEEISEIDETMAFEESRQNVVVAPRGTRRSVAAPQRPRQTAVVASRRTRGNVAAPHQSRQNAPLPSIDVPQPSSSKEEAPLKFAPAADFPSLEYTVAKIEDFIEEITETNQWVLVRRPDGKREVAQLKSVANQNLDMALDFLLSRD